MSKELYVTSTPHETKLAVVEDDQLVEVFFERENEYTLAGSIYKGKVTRVLPGMQSAFVEIGLERDAFLYVTDFLEEVEEDDSEPVRATPEAGERTERPERSERPEGTERPERGRRDRGRHRRGRPNGAPRTDAPSEGSFTLEHDSTESEDVESFATPPGAAVTSSPTTEELPDAAPTGDSDSRGARRWRGRRGRRRGRGGVPEAKFASAETETSPIEALEVLPQAHEDAAEMDEAFTSEPERMDAPRAEEHESEAAEPQATMEARPVQEERPRREERPRPQPMILPGESLAKFGRKAEGEKPQAAMPEQPQSRFAAPLPRPSTEYVAPTGFAAAGILAGESLAKYRNRPEQAERKENRGDVRRETRREEQRPQASAGEPVVQAEEESRPEVTPVPVPRAEMVAEVESTPEATASAGAQVEPTSAPGDRAYGFQPGQGVVEEEEIDEEEHEFAPFSEHLEEGEFEELEEETLEHREDEMIAAGEGLAEAFARSREQETADTYMSEEDDTEEDAEPGVVAEDQPEEAELYADEAESGEEEGMDGEESEGAEDAVTDPEDPDYAGRAETRGTAGTAGFQQRSAERGGRTDRRGRERDRGRRGGRPMRRGGPRRNIPRGPMPQINELLKEGQEILVQIAKEPMAKKGARITSHIALPGRFLVFMPTVNHTGVSRKIGSDEERQRLKRILLSEKGQSSGGFIVRTAAAGASEDDLRADIRFLINLWGEIKQRAETSKAPALIYHDLNLVERILRDQVTANFSHIWVDTEQEYERILRFASRFQPSLVKRVKLYTKDTPLFEQFNVQDEINKALKSKVWLKSGGYIVINQTEALVAIDINTGKYVGKTGRLEDTIVKTNLDAIKEIVRQIRLRDLGGIIIIDFIDMDERRNRQKVMQALEAELKSDRSPSKVLQFNDFGLVAITRKRVKQSLERTLSTTCVYCTGTGMIKSVATVCNEIYVEMRKMNRHLEGSQVMLRVNPEVAKALKENQGRWLVEMEELTGKSIIVKSDPAQHQEQFDIQ